VVVHACVRVTHGQLRILGPKGTCKSNERPLTWNLVGLNGRRGATGPQGPQGPHGAPGPSGPAGPAFVPTISYRSEQGNGVARAFCLPSEKLIGGGGFVEDVSAAGSERVQLRQSYPIADETGVIAWGTTAIGWQVASSNFEGIVGSFAICAS
jgi:hypothetical protein